MALLMRIHTAVIYMVGFVPAVRSCAHLMDLPIIPCLTSDDLHPSGWAVGRQSEASYYI